VGFLKEAFQVPYVFTIYINDLPDVVQNIANLFSDDTKVYARKKNNIVYRMI
jgi:hypothetical protein